MKTTFWIIFSVMATVAAAVVAFYAFRHKNPRFRPRAGEVLLVSLVALMVVGVSSWYLAGFFTSVGGFDPSKGSRSASSLDRTAEDPMAPGADGEAEQP